MRARTALLGGRVAHILLIEDESLVANTIEVMLIKAGHTVTVASDGEIGLRKFDEASADLVITDIIMPQKEGIATIRELRERSDVPIIAISGGGRTKNYDFLLMAQKLGATSFLRKPFSPADLVGMVARCLEGTAPVSEI